jgi:hypothetical protein
MFRHPVALVNEFICVGIPDYVARKQSGCTKRSCTFKTGHTNQIEENNMEGECVSRWER